MKYYMIILLVLLMCYQTRTFSQSCLPEGIRFETQEQLDNFQIDYPGCTEIEGCLIICGDNITNLNGLNVLTFIGGDLIVASNDSLISLSGLENLESIEGTLEVGGMPHINFNPANPCLVNLSGLDNLTTIGGDLRIQNSWALTDLSGLNNLSHLGGSLIIGYGNFIQYDNPYLTNLIGLDNLNSIGGDLQMQYNASLKNLAGLGNVSSIGGDFNIYYCRALESLEALNNLTYIGGSFAISCCDSLISLTGLENITSFEENVIFGGWASFGNKSLTKLAGLENVTSIGGNFEIHGCPFLASLAAMNNLTYIGGNFEIIGCDSLFSLTGLDNITTIESNIIIVDNISLTTCEVKSICDYLANPNGTVEIHDNATGCNSQQQVEGACGTSVKEINLIERISIYPNPFSTSTTIEFTLQQSTFINLKICNVLGEEIKSLFSGKRIAGDLKFIWDASRLPNGIYFVQVIAGNKVATQKLIKMR